MNFKARLSCLAGRHERSRSKARMSGDAFVSVCRTCGVTMRRIRDNTWVVDRSVQLTE
jgi:hypothetical protein